MCYFQMHMGGNFWQKTNKLFVTKLLDLRSHYSPSGGKTKIYATSLVRRKYVVVLPFRAIFIIRSFLSFVPQGQQHPSGGRNYTSPLIKSSPIKLSSARLQSMAGKT